MAYYITYEKKKGTYEPLDITKSACFVRNSKLRKNGATLEEIDLFTTQFNNEQEMRLQLIKENILPVSYANKALSARNLRNSKYHKVMYDFLYQKDIEYIINPSKLLYKIEEKSYINDFLFIENFATHFMNYRECSTTAIEIKFAAKKSQINTQIDKELLTVDDNFDRPLTRMTKLLIYNHYQYPSGHIEYYNTLKYRNLHAVIAFINNYDKKHTQEIKTQTFEGNSKRKTRKKEQQLPGQISFFDD